MKKKTVCLHKEISDHFHTRELKKYIDVNEHKLSNNKLNCNIFNYYSLNNILNINMNTC